MSVSIGLIGAGNMGRVHAAAYSNIDGVKLAGVTARTSERAERLGAEYGVRVFPDLAALLADGSIDAVDVTVPTPAHEEVVLAALGAGKHVLCETPFAEDAGSSARMLDAARSADRLLQVALLARVAQPGARLHQAVSAGELGEVEHAEFYRLAPVPDREHVGEAVRHYGDALEEILLFDIDLVTWLWGRPNSVRADMDRVEAGGFETAAVSLIYEGLRATITGGFAVPAGSALNANLRVAGSEAELSATLMVPPDMPPFLTCLLTPEGGAPQSLPLAAEDPYLTECRHFIDCVRGEADPGLLSAESAHAAFEVLDAARASVERGERVRLREP